MLLKYVPADAAKEISLPLYGNEGAGPAYISGPRTPSSETDHRFVTPLRLWERGAITAITFDGLSYAIRRFNRFIHSSYKKVSAYRLNQ